MNELKNCFNRSQLRRVEPSVEKSKLSIKQAREWLVEVEKNLEKYLFNFSMVYGM